MKNIFYVTCFSFLLSLSTPAVSLTVSNRAALLDAVGSQVQTIEIQGSIKNLDSFTLKPGQALIGIGHAKLTFNINQDGLRLSKNNTIKNISIIVEPTKKAISNVTTHASLGNIYLDHLTVTGQIQFLAKDAVQDANIDVRHVVITQFDSRFSSTISKYGIQAFQGAMTIWNQQHNPNSKMNVAIQGLTVGAVRAPSQSSGLFLAGTIQGGQVHAVSIKTDRIVIRGIDKKRDKLLASGIFNLNNSTIDTLDINQPIMTQDDYALGFDNWGNIQSFRLNETIETTGKNSNAMVNLGNISTAIIDAPIFTKGLGARGFSNYGVIHKATINKNITTYGNGAIGLQNLGSIKHLVISGIIRTHGGQAKVLQLGKFKLLNADAIEFVSH
ncbi:MAG TPA: hypothetical protein VGV92_02760 [Gammaproteobacteria bacterium]|nr:hypothetical protein [Gammaproteobacteria bacterium]